MTSILQMTNEEAREFFLSEESYSTIGLPHYFKFQPLLHCLDHQMKGRRLEDFYNWNYFKEQKINPHNPKYLMEPNHLILSNKDGKNAFRLFELIHPAIYVSLVHRLTEWRNWDFIIQRIKDFDRAKNIKCVSFQVKSDSEPSNCAATINSWWQGMEQKSIEMALCYNHTIHADIKDCYATINTETISWALHSRETAEDPKYRKWLLGNTINQHFLLMSKGYGIGIPQGSVLMNFIAEIILGFADSILSSCLENHGIVDYQIIRYRDDYRIFANSDREAKQILDILSKVLFELGLGLNKSKTIVSNDLINCALKPDKLAWISKKEDTESLQRFLLRIYAISKQYPNSGSLVKALSYFNELLSSYYKRSDTKALISIIVNISFNNPRVFPICCAIIVSHRRTPSLLNNM